MSVIVDFSIFPVGKGESLSGHVARAVRLIKESGLPHEIGPMGTSVEGEWDQVMALVGRCFQAMKTDANRVYMTIKVDYRKGASGRLQSKLRALEEKMEGVSS